MKKNLKKASVLLMCLIMAMSLLACGEKSDSKNEFEAMLEKKQSADSMDVDFKIDMGMNMDGFAMDLNMDGSMKINKLNSADLEMEALFGMSMLGMTLDYSMYYTDGYVYQEMMGEKVKSESSMEEAMEMMAANPEMMNIGGIDSYKDLAGEKDGDKTVYTYTVDLDELNNLMDGMSSGLLGEMTGDIGDSEYRVESVSGKTTLDKDGNCLEDELSFDMVMDMEGSAVDVSVTMAMSYNSIGQNVTIDFPDFSDFEEVDLSDLY